MSIFAASLGAYALVRLKWRGTSPLSTAVLVAYLMPQALMFIPLYAILTQLKLINTQAALMVTYPTVVLPFATWLMMGYYRSIPEELEDAAMIDGCNRFQTYYKVVLPLVRPALLAVAHVLGDAVLERVPVRQDVPAQHRDLHAAGRSAAS